MIDPIIFSFKIFGINLAVHWYGLLAAVGVLVGGLITERQITQRGGKEGYLWDLLLWVIPAGIVGARLGYVLNDIAGGSRYFLDDPKRILYITQGGLHIYGSIALGPAGGLPVHPQVPPSTWPCYWIRLPPGLLIGQAIGRVANFINQELYGQPTTLPWGHPHRCRQPHRGVQRPGDVPGSHHPLPPYLPV